MKGNCRNQIGESGKKQVKPVDHPELIFLR